jgi:hypothetical protein
VKGDLFRIAEWYGWSGKPNQGLQMLDNDVAAGIVERELAMGLHGRVRSGPADNSIWDIENGNSVASRMAASVKVNGSTYKGIEWVRSNKAPGSRKHGWLRCREYLKNGLPAYIVGPDKMPVRVPRERPGLFTFQTCPMFIDLFPTLPRDTEKDPDDVDTESEDHIGDETRYEVLHILERAVSGTTKGT